MRRILIISVCVFSFLVPVLADTLNNIDKRLLGTRWEGTYDLSSGHTGEIKMDMGDEKLFYFTLPDEENGYKYTGKIKEVIIENGVSVHADILKEIMYKMDEKTGKLVESNHLVTSPFEVILKGQWLKATPGPQEIIEGTINFAGTSTEAEWFLDKTGHFEMIPALIK